MIFLRGFKYHLAPAASALGLLYLVIALGSHYHFALRDSFGSFCTIGWGADSDHSGLKNVAGKQRAELIYDTSSEASNLPNNLCVSTGVFVETGARYRIVVKRMPELETHPPMGNGHFLASHPTWVVSRSRV